MKIALLLSFSLLVLSSASGQRIDYWAIDQRAEVVTASTPDSLAARLTAPYTTNPEKVRSIFSWITAHIEYDMNRYNRPPVNARQAKPVGRDTSYDDRSLNERIAYSVIKKGRAVCDGYARLFQTLCDYAGIPAVIISGYARSNGDSVSSRFNANHSWNAVYLDSAWRLLDATWASGYVISGTNTFVKSLDESYYLPTAEKFQRTHYPEDPNWALTANLNPPKEFGKSPFKPMAFYKYGVRSFYPATGTVEALPGDTIHIQVVADPSRLRRIASTSNADVLPPAGQTNYALLNRPISVAPGRLLYTYIVPLDAPQWINLVYNDDLLLRYQLKIR